MNMRYFSSADIKSKWIAWVLGLGVTMHVLLIRFHYSTDTAVTLQLGNQPYWHNHGGRPLTALVSWLLDQFKINLAAHQIECTISAVIILSICVHLLSLCSKIEDPPRKVLIYAAAYLSVFNPLLEDYFLFPEFVIFSSMSMAFTVLAVMCVVSRPGGMAAGISFLLLTIGLCLYQASFGFFIPLSMLFLSAGALNFRDFFKKTVLVFTVYLAAGLMNYAYTAFFSGIGFTSNRINKNILDRGRWLMDNIMEKLMHSLSAFATWIIIVSGCVAIMGFLFWIFHQKDKGRSIRYLYLLIIFVCLLIVSLIPILMSDYPGISPRSIAPLGGAVGIIMMFIILHEKLLPRYLYIVTGVVFILNFMVIIMIDADRIAGNGHDIMIAKQVIFQIHKHEETTGEMVTQIAVVADKNPTLKYDDLKTIYRHRIMSTDWAIPAFLSHFGKREFKCVPMPDSVYQDHFKDKDWNIFSEDQVYINNGTLYLAIY